MKIILWPLLAAAVMAGCSGGGAGSPGTLYGRTTPSAPATASPPPATGATPSPAPGNAAVLATATLKGAPGFVNSAQHTVYVFDADLASPGHSVCNGACTQNWPPVAPPAGVTLAGSFSTITRDDGSVQLTYKGRPLYTFIADGAPGQTNGDGLDAFGGIWHIARP
ncbi:MAG: COG4315 family predicted lipoprotein [Vulcanimicrobiaceae bacterium]